MSKKIVEQSKRGLKGFEIGGFHSSGDYSTLQEEYYKYFGDTDYETRKYAIAAFTCMLGTWNSGFCRVFVPIAEWEEMVKFDNQYQKRFYRFKDYIYAFLEHHEQIESEFPFMFEYIITFLIEIEQKKGISYEEWFLEHNPNLFSRLRDEILIPRKHLVEKNSPIKYFLKEVGIEPYFDLDKY